MSSVPGSRQIGIRLPGYEIPMINERAVRASAGILFLCGGIAFANAYFKQSIQPLQPFGMIFMLDMLIRVTLGDRWSPSMFLGRLAVRNQQPEWVGAPQKKFAWWLGFSLATISCLGMGLLSAPLSLTLALCSVCLVFLFLETSFGICVGCVLQARFSKEAPQYCAGGVCPAPTAR
ncbi:DUF4395 domain-containing protein [Corynebacterium breve]|uniref:DUF4395 domain-containing protein n=1 Tax=Corynebacterium breve TaxID=3049799 RepID=A0ABY8VFB9_9CORY|nr:DUF4395 domain-containing protein [Corynebacterium breve]WIM68334.1 DUF4395 domain-containing protein [Corynebacterium breve]